ADTFVPLANSTELRQASANPESRLLVVPGADHVKSFTANPDLYLSILDPFLDQQIREHGG
ncbi:MAG TPA: alpha/beta hydrolase, partial [Candidatus Dormibacteraeota bacterium]